LNMTGYRRTAFHPKHRTGVKQQIRRPIRQEIY
jgi:hypothetical protein